MMKINRNPATPDLPVYNRNRTRAPKVPPYEKERDEACNFFSDPAHFADNKKITDKKSPSFTVYKNKGLRTELIKVFGTKCAYCESDFGAVTPSDVEHFRPKNEITSGEFELKPGYYWLAGDWTNLLLSCVDCNRAREHKVANQPQTLVLGKTSQFPLADENVRVRHHESQIDLEAPSQLLIDPCEDDPEEHLEFFPDGTVRARVRNGVASPRGEASIYVYALLRHELVIKRKAALDRLDIAVTHLEKQVAFRAQLSAVVDDPVFLAQQDELVEDALAGVASMFSPQEEYLAAKRDWVRSSEAAGKFDTLREVQIEPMDLIT
ncbi:hypothetical protein NBRC116590_16860 [Pelagimonas sp. KU-00592-HH]|uniref:hypothetical protein n=1 Tax=Pelagimonas sp. KU-00592-HH TaxID=3127651 RepID=UPI0031073ADA